MTAGRTMCLQVPLPDTGSQPRFTLKKSISMMPSQKLGIASPRTVKMLNSVSGSRFL